MPDTYCASPTDTASSGAGFHRSLLALCLGLFLFGLYSLTYSPYFESSDGVSIYAVAESIAKRGAFDSSPFIWDRWTAGYQDAQGDYGIDGELYSKKGLGASIFAAPLTWLALRLPGIGLVQATYLFNMIVTAVTAMVLFLFIWRLGYGRDVALLVGGLFGTATIAWPYAGYLYSEPLMGLFLVLAAYFLYAFRQECRWLFLFGGGLAAGWAAVTRLTNLILLPVYYLYAFGPVLWEWATARRPASSGGSGRRVSRGVVVFSVGLGLGLAVIGLYNILRFQTPFRSGYAETVGFWTPLTDGLYGLFFSPRKSLFLYSPVLILAPLSFPFFLKRHWKEGLFLLLLFGIPVVTFAKWMDWEGGLAWGPRYLVSVVPFMMVASAPALAWMLQCGWIVRGPFLLLVLWSVVTQAVAASLHFGHYLRALRPLAAEWSGPELAVSAPIAPWVFSPRIIGPDLIELEWFHLSVDGTVLIRWAPLLATLAFTAVAAALLFWVRLHMPRRRTAFLLGLGGLTLAVVLWGFNLRQYYHDPRRGAGDDYMALVGYLERRARPDDVLLVSNHMYMGFFMNYNRSPVQWYALLSKGADPALEEEGLLERVVSRHRRVWLAIDRVPELGLPRPAEKWLTLHAYQMDEQVFSDYARLLLYTTGDHPDQPTPGYPLGLNLDRGIRLVGYDLSASAPPTELTPGDEVRLSLLWEAKSAPRGDYKVFVQVLNGAGELVWQVDRRPAAGFRPTVEWRVGEWVRDNYGLRVPEDWPPGHYRLIVGLYDPVTMERLTVVGQEGSGNDHVELLELTVR